MDDHTVERAGLAGFPASWAERAVTEPEQLPGLEQALAGADRAVVIVGSSISGLVLAARLGAVAKRHKGFRVVLVAGPKDHGAGEHDYPAWQKAWAALVRRAAQVEVATGWEWPAREEFRKADVLVFYQHGDWTADRAATPCFPAIPAPASSADRQTTRHTRHEHW